MSKINNITKNYYSDEWFTSRETVEFMYRLLNINSEERERNTITIMCPYDSKDSEFVKYGLDRGYKVIYGIQDFLEKDYDYDYLITNPPFSIKDDVIEKCIKDGKRSCLVLPISSLSGVRRHSIFKENDIKLNVFIPTRRVNYFNLDGTKKKESNFESIFMILDKDIKENKIKYEYELNKEIKL